MKNILNTYYLNGTFYETGNAIEDEGSLTYDVLRVINGVPLFLEAHIDRVNSSLSKNSIEPKEELRSVLADLIKINGGPEINMNIKILAGGAIDLAVGFIESSYPAEKMYQDGIELVSARISRDNPGSKVWHDGYKNKIIEILKESNAFEVLLVDKDDLVTEGSKSNVFFIRDNKIYTPQSDILPGITRRYVQEAIKNLGIELIAEEITIDDAYGMDQAFITGTSLNILPINKIDEKKYIVESELLSSLMDEFQQLIQKDLKTY